MDTDFKDALRAKDADKLGLLRLVRSAVKNLEIARQAAASEEDIVAILQREIKQHRETASGFRAALRPAEAARQEAEITILESYLPPRLSPAELEDVVAKAIAATAAQSLKDLGKVMGAVMPQVKGRTTGDEVGQMVREMLEKK